MSSEYQRGLEDAARIADFYETESFRLAADTHLTDPVLRNGDLSQAALKVSEQLQLNGVILASRAHAARDIAAAIRAGHIPPPSQEPPDA